MSEWRRAKNRTKKDANEKDIVDELLKEPGISVELGHDDILVGFRGKTYWFEIKDPAKTLDKDGRVKKDAIKPSQIKLLREYTGHYRIVWTLDEILKDLGFLSCD